MIRNGKSTASTRNVVDGDGSENQPPNPKANQRRHVINSVGEACFRNVDPTGDITVTCPIPVTTVEVTDAIYRCKDGKGLCRDRIAHEKEAVQYIWNGDNPHVWLKAESIHESKNGILHRRSREYVASHSREVMTSVQEIQAQKLGVSGPRDFQTDCIFLPFGLKKDTRVQTGVWVSIKYYSEVMIPKVISLGYDPGKCKDIKNQLLHSGRSREEKNEEEVYEMGREEVEEDEDEMTMIEEEEEKSETTKTTPETQAPEPSVSQPIQQYYFQQVLYVPFLLPPPPQFQEQQENKPSWCLAWYLPDFQ